MIAPRLEIDLDKISHNARVLVERLIAKGISVTGVTKASCGSLDIARAMLRGGVKGLGDSRIENIEGMRRSGVSESMTLLRSPMLSQTDRVVANADLSLNTEVEVLAGLSRSGQRLDRMHGIVLMVELGDLREGIMPEDLLAIARETVALPNLELRGIGTNLACRSGVSPDARNMAELSALAVSIEDALGLRLDIVSGGNSANLDWALEDSEIGRINDLRLGESILLGCETLHRQPIDGLHCDAITLVAEVIESKTKPTRPWGEIAQSAFGEQKLPVDRGPISQTILALGRQDTDPEGLSPPPGNRVIDASSDHLLVESSARAPEVGSEMRFGLNYSAMARAMASPFVARVSSPQSGRITAPQ